ncbi:hypothetical protein PAECIP112173_01685 [Paenibacillus sp. JJ-100]|uniref:hypothetical protein n=1 Tax=Paenibacillus sp. JJ-100 TaxID=2974896 RepID=UPI0022FF8E4D|nr:hypothetical protein [Paenibacillus sp. JJ-100]CAI6058417.1 hypothetical protein PAECIP112173_01685 [Paenibacillus sp. JJ-100]
MDNHVKDTLRRLEQGNRRVDHLRAFLENGAGDLSPPEFSEKEDRTMDQQNRLTSDRNLRK